MSALLLTNEQEDAVHIGSRFNWNRSGQVLTELVNDELGCQAPAQERRQCRSTHAIALASQSSMPMAATLCRPYLPRLASILTVIAGSHLYRSRPRGGCVQRAIGQLVPGDGAPARSSELREGAPGPASCVLAREIAFEKREADGRQPSAPAD